MSAAAHPLYTEEDLERLSAEGRRYELIDGELIPISPSGGEHARTTMALSARATVYVEDHGLGLGFAAEGGFRIGEMPGTVLAPDWAFIRRDRLPDPIPDGFVPVVPDLVLETRSPGDSRKGIEDKIALWLRSGVQVVWDLDPKGRTLSVHRRGGTVRSLGIDDVLTEEELLPGFSVRIASLF